MTLEQLKRLAFEAGYKDAKLGRVYRDSYQPQSELRILKLDREYEQGWKAGRECK